MTEIQELNARIDNLIIDIKINKESIEEFRDENHELHLDNLKLHKRLEGLEASKDTMPSQKEIDEEFPTNLKDKEEGWNNLQKQLGIIWLKNNLTHSTKRDNVK